MSSSSSRSSSSSSSLSSSSLKSLGALYAKMLSRRAKLPGGRRGGLSFSKHPRRLLAAAAAASKKENRRQSIVPSRADDSEAVDGKAEEDASTSAAEQQLENEMHVEEEEEGEEGEGKEEEDYESSPPDLRPKRPRHSFYLQAHEEKEQEEGGEMDEDSDASSAVHFNRQPSVSFTSLLKVAKEMPHWNHSSVSYEFLRSLKLKLAPSGWPQREWIRLLPYLFDQKDTDKAEWVTKNIVQKTTSWNTACELFNEHFQDRDHRAQWNADYEKCKQLSHETVQSYADRFQRICTQLGIADDNDRAIEHFITHLTPTMIAAYYPHMSSLVATAKVTGGAAYAKLLAQKDSLDGVIQKCIELDVANRTAAQAIAQRANMPGGHPSSAYDQNKINSNNNNQNNRDRLLGNNNKRRFNQFSKQDQRRGPSTPFGANRGGGNNQQHAGCKYHPNSTDHTTAECRYGQFIQRTQQAPATNNNNYNNSNDKQKKDISEVTCHACGQKGHYANTCTKKEATGAPNNQQGKKPFMRATRHVPSRGLYQQDGADGGQDNKNQGAGNRRKH